MLNLAEVQKYLDVATKAAMAGGEILREGWKKAIAIRDKKIPGDLVTEIDELSEKTIIEIIRQNFPDHPIMAEESGFQSADRNEILWCIDPLDGTTNYTHHYPFVAVSIAMLYQRQAIVGVVYNPILDELFRGAKGLGALLNHHDIAVSNVKDLEKSLLATGFPYNRRETEDNNFKEFYHLLNKSQGVRRAGAASLDLAYVATGRIDGYWESGLKSWDVAAGAVLVEEAGGKVTSYNGEPLNILNPKILASNAYLHDQLISELSNIKELNLRINK